MYQTVSFGRGDDRDQFAGCELCALVARDAARAGTPRRCSACSQLWVPEAVRDDPATERPWRPGDPKTDGKNLARWLPAITGSAMPSEPTPGGGGGKTNGRRDHVDEEHRSLRRATAMLSHLNRMARAGHGSHAEVIFFAYVASSEELAKRFIRNRDKVTDDPTQTERSLVEIGRARLIGTKFWPASRGNLDDIKSATVRESEPRTLGERLLAEAIALYMQLGDDGRVAAGVGAVRASEEVGRMLDESIASTAAKWARTDP